MALDSITLNLDFINQVLKRRKLTSRQVSKLIFGNDTRRDIIKEITNKPDVRASTLVRLCRALGISMDSLYQNSDNDSLKIQAISGIGIVTNSTNVRIDIANLQAENKALKLLIAEKDKRLDEMAKDKEQLGKRLDVALQLGHNQDTKN